MLSRVAESLYWMARYVERAEAVSRLVAVHFQALLDGGRRGWQGVVQIGADAALAGAPPPDAGEAAVLEYLFSHPGNHNCVLACLLRARENARGARDQISSEMWEQLNQLYFLARDGSSAWQSQGPYRFFRQVRDGSQAFEGVANATMTHGEAFEFIQLGRHLERAATTIRVLGVRHAEVSALPPGTVTASLELIALLKTCSAFEPFRRHRGASLQPGPVAEYLLLNPQFPRAVLFCLNRSAEAVDAVAPPSRRNGDRLDGPARLLGRLKADLAYLDVDEVLAGGLHPLLDDLLGRIYAVHGEVTRTYFNTRVILPSPQGDGARQQQQQQQQARA